jgi:biopolymer transport protein ExbD
MRKKFHRRSLSAPELDITAFMNLMVVLVPFLLITAVFSHISILELNIPPALENTAIPAEALQLEITIRKESVEVGDRDHGMIRRIDKQNGQYDYKTLSEVLQQIKARFPDKTAATILAEADVPYEVLIHVMDATRAVPVFESGSVVQAELFPDISIGDAPRPAEQTP